MRSPTPRSSRFLTIDVITAFATALIAGLIFQNLAAACGAFAVGGYLPMFVLNFLCNRRLKTLTKQLPEALDFLSRIMRAGHSLSTGLQMMADELPKPLSAEFRKVYDQHSLGQPLEEALKEMSIRVDSTDFSFFVTAVLIQRQTGGDLSEVLGNISNLVRQRMRLSQSVAAKTAEGRFTGLHSGRFSNRGWFMILLLPESRTVRRFREEPDRQMAARRSGHTGSRWNVLHPKNHDRAGVTGMSC